MKYDKDDLIDIIEAYGQAMEESPACWLMDDGTSVYFIEGDSNNFRIVGPEVQDFLMALVDEAEDDGLCWVSVRKP